VDPGVSVDAVRQRPAERVATLAIWSSRVEPLPLTGGITNQNFTVEDRGRRYVVRVGDINAHRQIEYVCSCGGRVTMEHDGSGSVVHQPGTRKILKLNYNAD